MVWFRRAIAGSALVVCWASAACSSFDGAPQEATDAGTTDAGSTPDASGIADAGGPPNPVDGSTPGEIFSDTFDGNSCAPWTKRSHASLEPAPLDPDGLGSCRICQPSALEVAVVEREVTPPLKGLYSIKLKARLVPGKGHPQLDYGFQFDNNLPNQLPHSTVTMLSEAWSNLSFTGDFGAHDWVTAVATLAIVSDGADGNCIDFADVTVTRQ